MRRSRRHLIGESTLEADIARRSALVDDDPHGDATRGADRRAIVIDLGLAVLVHAATLLAAALAKEPQHGVV